MASTDILIAFALATLVFAAYPGPALLYTIAQTLGRGRKAGLFAAFGLHCGCYAHVAAAALGLSAIFRTVPTLYLALKLAGALYLVWLGVSMFLAKDKPGEMPTIEPRTPWRAFAQSVIVELLNPKVAIFFIAFLPQFVDSNAAYPLWLQFVILGTIVNIVFSTGDIIAVLLASSLRGWLGRKARAQMVIRKVGGSLLAGLGVRLALDRS